MHFGIHTIRQRLATLPFGIRLAHGVFWSIVGTVTVKAVTTIGMVLVARLLGKDDFGRLAIVQSTIGMAGVFAGLGLSLTTAKYTAELRTKASGRLGRIIALSNFFAVACGAIATVVLILTSRLLSESLLHNSTLAPMIVIGACMVLFGVVEGAQTGVLAGFEAFRSIAIAGLIAGVIGTTLTVSLAIINGTIGAIVGLSVQSLIQMLTTRHLLQARCVQFGVPLGQSDFWREWRIIRDFSLPALICGSLVMPAHWICQALLVRSTNGLSEMGFLAVAMQWFSIVMFVPSLIGRAVAPILTERITADNQKDAKTLLVIAVVINASVAVPIAAIAAALSPWILSLYGASFQGGALALVIAIVVGALFAVQAPIGNVLVASSRLWLGALMNLGWATTFVGFTFLLVEYGAAGVTAALGMAYLAHATWTYVFARRILSKEGADPSLIASALDNKLA